MILDIYVGAFTNYYEQLRWEWKTSTASPDMTKIPVTIITIPENVEASRQERLVDVAAWRDRLNDLLASKVTQPLDWNEAERLYAVATPHHEGMRALRLWAVYAELPNLRPPRHPVDLMEDAAYLRAASTEGNTRFLQIIQNVDFWLPVDFDLVFRAEGPNGKSAEIGSALALLKQLDNLNASTWKAGQDTIEEWEVVGHLSGGSLEQQAKYAFSQVFLAAQFSRDNRLPMILDG
jgi:hypothetical protein